jgi:hypothetical protein
MRKDWTWADGRLVPISIEWDSGDFDWHLEQWGFEEQPIVSFCDEHNLLHVHAFRSENGEPPIPCEFIVFHSLSQRFYYVFLPDYAALLGYIGYVAPLQLGLMNKNKRT